MRTESVGPQIQRLLLEHVFHLSARAVELFVESLGREAPAVFVSLESLGRQVGHHKTRVVARGHHFGFANHSARPTPTLPRLIFKRGEDAHAFGPAQTTSRPRV